MRQAEIEMRDGSEVTHRHCTYLCRKLEALTGRQMRDGSLKTVRGGLGVR